MQTRPVTTIIQREAGGYVALCPELEIASQGDSIEQARDNLAEAVQAFFESADADEIERRLHTEVCVMRFEVAVSSSSSARR